jgi:hypothetical protein
VVCSATVPLSGVPGSVTETVTVLKSAAVTNALAGDCEPAVKSAPDVATPAHATIAANAAHIRAARLMRTP